MITKETGMTDATTVQMPQRWDFAGDYDDYLVPLEEGDYVKVEDVSPLVAEINRLRDNLAKARRITDELLNGDQDYRDVRDDLWILQSVLKD
jgi:hypothetical protein